MQNPIPKFRQSSIFSEKPGYLSRKLETLKSSNYMEYIFYWNFAHFSYLTLCKKNVWDFS